MLLTIAYEDSSLLIIDKPQGLAVTPGALPCLCEAVFAQWPALSSVPGYRVGEGGLLNRLDNETGGLVLFAKTETAFLYYAKAMAEDRIEKLYMAVIHGNVSPPNGEIRLPVGHSKKNHKKMVTQSGKRAIKGNWQAALTTYKTLEAAAHTSLLDITITRGVRHQIRVHLAALDAPVVGDKLYSRIATELPCQLLYAYGLRFLTPDGQAKEIRVNIPFLENWKTII